MARELGRARRTGATLAVAFGDVDGLKRINDTQGHLAGDALLRLVGETLRANLRPYDVIVRYGGDEHTRDDGSLNEDSYSGGPDAHGSPARRRSARQQ